MRLSILHVIEPAITIVLMIGVAWAVWSCATSVLPDVTIKQPVYTPYCYTNMDFYFPCSKVRARERQA